MIGGKFPSLTIMSNEDTDIDSMITTFNTAVTETASEILGKHHQKKKSWITAEILELCNKRSKTHKKLKERVLIRRNRTKHANFRCNHLFRATYNITENS